MKKETAKIAELHESINRLERILIETVETYRIATNVMIHAIGTDKIDKAANEILTKEEWGLITTQVTNQAAHHPLSSE